MRQPNAAEPTCAGGVLPRSTSAFTNAHIATCTVWWRCWCLWLYFLCDGGCIYGVVVAVHGGFAAVTQPRIHHEERSPAIVFTSLCTDSRWPMYCARIRLLSLARPGVSDNVANNT